jgi:hypothetical protein
MRAGRWTWVWGLAVAGQLWGSAGAAGEVVGRWTNATTVLTLFGSGVGWRSDTGRDAFAFTLADTNLLTLRFGGGSSVAYDAAVRGDELELTLSGATARYSRAASPGSACQTNLLSLEAAKAVFLRDNPGALRVSVGELVPAYLQTLPACEGGGHYTLGPPAVKPACSSHGTVSE